MDFGCQAVTLANPNFFGDQISKKYADNETPLPGGGGVSKWTLKFNLCGLWMIVFHFLVLPNMACPCTLSQNYLGIWFWGTHGVMNIV